MPQEEPQVDTPMSPVRRARLKPNALASKIKKLMQSDDEVGKIAQATPCLIGRALELFLSQLVESSADRATKNGGRIVLPGHIKLEVAANPTFDFLRDMESVTRAPDPPPPVEKKPPKRRRAKAAAEAADLGSDDGSDGGSPKPIKKPRKPRAKPRAKAKVALATNSDSDVAEAPAHSEDVSGSDFEAKASRARRPRPKPRATRRKAKRLVPALKENPVESDIDASEASALPDHGGDGASGGLQWNGPAETGANIEPFTGAAVAAIVPATAEASEEDDYDE